MLLDSEFFSRRSVFESEQITSETYRFFLFNMMSASKFSTKQQRSSDENHTLLTEEKSETAMNI